MVELGYLGSHVTHIFSRPLIHVASKDSGLIVRELQRPTGNRQAGQEVGEGVGEPETGGTSGPHDYIGQRLRGRIRIQTG